MKKKSSKNKESLSGHWIGAMNDGAGPKKGALHKELGVPSDKKIPKSKIKSAAKKKGIIGKRARLAETLEGFGRKKKK